MHNMTLQHLQNAIYTRHRFARNGKPFFILHVRRKSDVQYIKDAGEAQFLDAFNSILQTKGCRIATARLSSGSRPKPVMPLSFQHPFAVLQT